MVKVLLSKDWGRYLLELKLSTGDDPGWFVTSQTDMRYTSIVFIGHIMQAHPPADLLVPPQRVWLLVLGPFSLAFGRARIRGE